MTTNHRDDVMSAALTKYIAAVGLPEGHLDTARAMLDEVEARIADRGRTGLNAEERAYLRRVSKERWGLSDHHAGWTADEPLRARLVKRGLLKLDETKAAHAFDDDCRYVRLTEAGRAALHGRG